jgi:hypothetical protein
LTPSQPNVLSPRVLDKHVDYNTEVTKVDRDKLLSLTNPRYKEVIEIEVHLLRWNKDQDVSEKPELLVHLNPLGANKYAKISGPPAR